MRSCLLIIDPQVDFHEGGSLAVPGAIADSERIVNFLRNNQTKIDHVIVTLDSHRPDHIAHAKMWKDQNNHPPPVFTRIHSQDIKDNVWLPVNGDKDYAISYTEKLESKGKFYLTIWPEHCLLGTSGHEIYPTLKRALEEWSHTTGKHVETVMKGQNIKTEMYSALEAEIPDNSDPGTWLNQALLEKLQSFDQIFVGGQALSHCVNYTVRDILNHWDSHHRAKVIVFQDGASVVPGCEKDGEDFLAFVEQQGGKVLNISQVSL